MRLAVLLIGLAITSLDVGAQQVTELVRFTNTWRYENSRTDLGTAWRARAFVDTSWSSGVALLGLEDSVPNPYAPHGLTVNVIDIGPNPGRTPTIYFRTHFTSPIAGTTPGVSLILSNLVDDGCVIYLNGTEAGRVRVAANQTYASFATGAGTEGALDTVVITNLALLTAGDNVLAVEVHNAATDSSDLVYGARLMLLRQTALSITNQPQDESVFAGATATFTVGVSGGPVTYRWYRGNTPLLSTSNRLDIPNVQPPLTATNYYVVVSNIVNMVTSRLATLTIETDTDGPKMIRAVIANAPCGVGSPFSTNSINVVWATRDGRDPCSEPLLVSEPLNGATTGNTNNSVRNQHNYRLVSSTNSNIQIAITNVLYTQNLGALLNVDTSNTNWNPAGSYYLIVNNIADDRGNNIAPNSVIAVSRIVSTNLTQISDPWIYYDAFFLDPNFPNTYTDNLWYTDNYVPDTTTPVWGSGIGIFQRTLGIPLEPCAGDPVGTDISFQAFPTLFRRTFVLPGNLGASSTFAVRHIIDDGLVLYLNGLEIYRFNMPTGPLTMDSKALNTVNGGVCVTNVQVSVTNLRPGTNLLAAAVYQDETAQGDTAFGLEMDGRFTMLTGRAPSLPTNQLRLAWTTQANQLRLSWPVSVTATSGFYGFNLMSTTNLNTPWLQVSNQSNPYTNPMTGRARFFKLVK